MDSSRCKVKRKTNYIFHRHPRPPRNTYVEKISETWRWSYESGIKQSHSTTMPAGAAATLTVLRRHITYLTNAEKQTPKTVGPPRQREKSQQNAHLGCRVGKKRGPRSTRKMRKSGWEIVHRSVCLRPDGRRNGPSQTRRVRGLGSHSRRTRMADAPDGGLRTATSADYSHLMLGGVNAKVRRPGWRDSPGILGGEGLRRGRLSFNFLIRYSKVTQKLQLE